MKNTILGLLAAALGSLAFANPAAAAQWKTYDNSRFLYEICYPADLLTPQPEADNNDGRVFTGADGANLRVWGNYNAADYSLAAVAKELAPDGATVSYRHVTKTSAVVSGKDGDAIFYAKVLFEKGDSGTLRSFILAYPAAKAATYNPIALRLATCFKAVQ
jgi:hypothetical protein